ncbi:nucleoid occlusion protein [Salsuginibacillus kocurii]|uniref:nucleoid occlusion protein n=1 Tax=Salsuginibacillus kocurii TaxID=427078 RepID=UPI0003662E9F|nr:nucleoid occlusion protein [Salsuginibacillus kocurii]
MKHSLQRFFGLGDGSEELEEEKVDEAYVQNLPIEQVVPNPFQPREIFEEDKIAELAQSIRTHGLLQPITVRERNGEYEIIAGERRFRAIKLLEWGEIPALIKDYNDTITASLALIENLQREGLTAVEEAHAYARLIELQGLTQESLAQRLGKGQSTVANKLRLLHLPTSVQNALMNRSISERHARAMLGLKEVDKQELLLREIIDGELNVKQTEERIIELKAEPTDDLTEKPAKKKSTRKLYAKDTRLALNTIRQSLDMVEKTGMSLETNEEEHDDYIEFKIRVPKR